MAQGDVHVKIVGHLPDDPRFKTDGIGFDLGSPPDLFNIIIRHLLKPDCLPDSRGSRVPDGMRLQLPILLAARLGQLMRIVFHMHCHSLLTRRLEHVRDISPERRMATFVGNGEAAVYPDPRAVIDRPETQDYPSGKELAIKVPLIPARGMKAPVTDTARPGFRRKRYRDFHWPGFYLVRLRVLARVVIAKTPDAVE